MNFNCSICKKLITHGIYEYSCDRYREPLCIQHQKTSSPYSTPEARKLCYALIKRGIPAELEKFDGFKHIDIAIPELRVNIEVDGRQHYSDNQALADLKRAYHSFKRGYITLRIPNSLVQKRFKETVNYLISFLRESAEQIEDDENFWY